MLAVLMHNLSRVGLDNGPELSKDNGLGLGEETELMSGDVDSSRLKVTYKARVPTGLTSEELTSV